MTTVEIWDSPSIHLASLLSRISDVDRFSWTVMEMWAVARDDDFDVVALERQAEASLTGLVLSGVELRQLASKLGQFIDGILVGYSERAPQRSDDDLRDTADVVVEAIDSTCWRVFARDPAVIAGLRGAYRDVRDVAPETRIPPAHHAT